VWRVCNHVYSLDYINHTTILPKMSIITQNYKTGVANPRASASLKINVPTHDAQKQLQSLAYHVHFPGTGERVSGFVSPSKSVSIEVPVDALAVCLTLVKRFKRGWQRHSRCRFAGVKRIETLSLKDEQLNKGTDPPYGEATLQMEESISSRRFDIVTREWFSISKMSNGVFDRSTADWYSGLKAVDSSIERVHAPLWNNFSDVLVPGWCFAFPPPGAEKYSASDLEETFILASEMLFPISHTAANIMMLQVRDKDSILALGLTLFGMAIFYENDHTAKGVSVERFSSTARLDGLGDCEDIAKESALAFGDLVTFNRADNLFLCALSARAAQFQFCICLGAVQRRTGGEFEGHAFGLLIPNAMFPKELLTDDEAANLNPSDVHYTYLCDGVYDCHPTKKKISRKNDGILEPGQQFGPFAYTHIVSAFVFNKGEVFFTQDKRHKVYGVSFDDIFPRIAEGVQCVNALGTRASLAERHAAATSVLHANIPRAVRTYGRETQTPMDRFEAVVLETDNRSNRIQNTFDNMNPKMLVRFQRLEKKLRAPCLTQSAFTELRSNTTKFAETAFQIYDDGSLTERTQGGYGQVAEPSPMTLTSQRVATVGGHSHHRHHNQDYRPCNVPTPDDFIAFVSRRVWGLLSARTKKPLALHKAAVVITHNNVYELNETGQADGVVTCTYLDLAMRKNAQLTESLVGQEVRRRVTKLLKADKHNPFIKIDPKTNELTLKTSKVFEPGVAHDQYLEMFERIIRVRAVRQDVHQYTQQCDINMSP